MTTKPENTNKEFPKFISNRPCGKDKFGGDSQKRLAESIAEHFKRNDALDKKDALPRIIGIEGSWGSGKSNVVKLLKDKHLADYHFFEYDAWGHQEDLQRRSFLELLTLNLISNKILNGSTTITVKGGEKQDTTWSQKLKYLLARKTETITEKYPKISNGMAAAVLVAILTPIFTFIAYAVKPDNSPWWFILMSIFIAGLPVIVGLLVWCYVCKKDPKKYNLSYLLAIYQDKIENDICYETLSEDEPTSREFRDWMQDVSDCIASNKRKKLVVVFDNMDRLPAEKVKELWSSIHTFFAEDGFENVWAIIPFDQDHLACAFGDCENDEVKKLTKYFIAKTFPIVYRVPAPVITDYKDVFNVLFEEAFGQTQNNDKELINRIYRLEKPEPNIRDIIVFINKLVALRMQWTDNVSLINIALFALYQEDILVDSVQTILSGSYLTDKTSKIISNIEERQEQISALTYGVEIEVAKQIPLTKYIQGCFNSETDHDINKYADLKSFDSILEEVIADLDESLLDKATQCLNNLNKENKAILKLWNEIADRRIKQSLSKPEFEDAYKVLLQKTDQVHRKRIVSKLAREITNFKEFNGADYYTALSQLEDFLNSNKIEATLSIPEKIVPPQTFIDYVFAADETYTKYRLKTDPNDLDVFFTAMMPDKLTITAVIPILNKSQEYSFDNLLQRIEQAIADNEVKETNFEPIMYCYKNLSPNKPLGKQLSTTTISTLLSSFESKQQGGIYPSGYYDVVAMSLATGVNIGDSSQTTINRVAKLMDYYANYGDLMTSCVSWNIPLLNQVLKHMTDSGRGETLSIDKILPIYENVKATINVSDEKLLTQLDRLSKDALETISKENIKTIIPSAAYYSITASIANELTSHINKVAIEALSTVSVDELYAQRNTTTDYWHVTISAFLKTDLMKSLPENVSGFGKKILQDIASGTQSLPLNEYLKAIVDKLNKEEMASTMIEIKNNFCNGKGNGINAPKFILLEPWLRERGSLNDNADGVVVKILMPIINDSTCLNLIIKAPDNYYTKLIGNASNASTEFKKTFFQNYQGTGDSNILKFAQQIDVELNPESKK